MKALLTQNCKGFNVAEMMVALFTVALALAVAASVYTQSYARYNLEQDRGDSRSGCQSAMDYVLRDIRASSAALSSYGSYTGSASCLILQEPAYDASGIISGSYDYTAYWKNQQGQLARTVYPAAGSLRTAETGRALVSNVAGLTFQYYWRDTFSGSGSTTSFVLARTWTETPSLTVDGAHASATFDPVTRTMTLSSVPASDAVVEAVYPVSASDSAAKPDVYAVKVNVSLTRNTGREDQTVSLEGMTRMRNKR